MVIVGRHDRVSSVPEKLRALGPPESGEYDTGYINAFMIAYVPKACGDELTRTNSLKHATSLDGVAPPMLLPGIRLSNSPTD